MARGWESKSVEAQQDEASRDRAAVRPRALSADERVVLERTRTLRLQRARTLADLEKATRPAQQHMLQLGLAAIEEELARLR
jgi:predicted ATPase with chaperone activity